MNQLIIRSWRKIFSFTAQIVVKKYIQKKRHYTYKELKLVVLKDVFHPGLFRSTTVFASWIERLSLEGTKVLELGCGSALLSLIAASKGASVIAADINHKAVENAALNANQNHLTIQSQYSNLFSAFSEERFDIVLINPPFFPKDPQTDYEYAWFCGENFDYFRNIFSQLSLRPKDEKHYMILSSLCNMAVIENIGRDFLFSFEKEYEKEVSGEMLTIYNLVSINS